MSELPDTSGLIPTLISDRLTLRAPRQTDFECFAAFYASDRAKFIGGPLDRNRAWRQLATEAGHWALLGYGRWIVEETATGSPVGMVGLWNPEGWPEPEIGWDLFDGSEGKGFATEAALTARAYAYEVLGWTSVISLVAPANDASARVALRLGAALETDFDHATLGRLQVYRHPAPQTLNDQNAKATA